MDIPPGLAGDTSMHVTGHTPAQAPGQVPARPVLAGLQGARKSYGAVVALHDVDLALHAGDVLALLGANGANGAGKSTAVGLLLGMATPDAGQATLLGLPPQALAARRAAGVMLQSAGLPDTLRVDELLALVRSYYDDPLTSAQCFALAGLEGLERRRYGTLSGGQQRHVQFALAICGRPRVLFLDEPTTGLDVEAGQRTRRRARGRVVPRPWHPCAGTRRADACAGRGCRQQLRHPRRACVRRGARPAGCERCRRWPRMPMPPTSSPRASPRARTTSS